MTVDGQVVAFAQDFGEGPCLLAYADATLTAELVHTGLELASRDAEVAQLRQALTGGWRC